MIKNGKKQENLWKLKGEKFIFQADLTDRAQVSAAVEECIRVYGKIDVLVNNAEL